jgi:hypothetical protein
MGRVAAALALAVLLATAPATANGALLRNGALGDGRGPAPHAWRSAAWSIEHSRFGWNRDETPPTLSIVNVEPNDAYWCQTVAVTPGNTYEILTEIRTEDVGTETAGAFISIEPRIGYSRLITGTSPWQPVQLRLQAQGPEQQWDVCLRLGSNGSLNTGTAWFRNVAMREVAIGAPPRTRGPSLAAQLWQWTRQTGWMGVLLPVGAGVALAFGFGIFDRRQPPRL